MSLSNYKKKLCFLASQHRSAEEGVEGGSVVISCRHRRIAFEEKQLTVYWRHNDTRNVHDIIHGEVSVKEQHPAYKNRTEVLPDELKKGRILLKLTDLQLSDRGTYICFVPDVGVHHSTQLVVKGVVMPPNRVPKLRRHSVGQKCRNELAFSRQQTDIESTWK